jgi:hypothetical protein
MTTSDMKSGKKKKKEKSDTSDDQKEPQAVEKACLKKMDKTMYKSIMIGMLDKLQTLYPNSTRYDLWIAIQDRLKTKFPDIYSAEEEK